MENIINEKFPRGLNSWLQTHYQVAQFMGYHQYSEDLFFKLDGEDGKQRFAEELTTKFETIHKDTDFVDHPNGSFYDILDEFLKGEVLGNPNKVTINFTESDIQEMQSVVGAEGNPQVFEGWSAYDEKGKLVIVNITVGDD